MVSAVPICVVYNKGMPSADDVSMDAKFGFDDNADFRQKDVFKLRDTTQEDAQEVEAAEVGYVDNRFQLEADVRDPSSTA